MYKQKLFRFLILVCTFCVQSTNAQIVATPSTGCSPLSVLFSGVAGASNEYWTLGSGMGTSLLSNPNVLYTSAGTYNITYTAVVAGNPVNYSTQVIVKPIPSASFSYLIPPSHCAPMPVNFTANSSVTSPVYTWAFGDLTPFANGSSLTHTYTFGGSFIPVLTILDPATSCTAVATIASGGTIHVSTPPVINITASNGFVGCVPPFVTGLDASGSISGSPIPGGTLTYNWNMLGGTPSSAGFANAGSVSFGSGTSTLVLQVTDNNQCSNTTTSLVTVSAPNLSLSIAGTVCINEPVSATLQTTESSATFTITNSNLTAPLTTVTIPGGSTVIDTLCFFTQPGIATLTVDIPTGVGCPYISVTKQIFVEQVIASFFPTPSVTACSSIATITFSNNSTVNNSSTLTYNWSSFWVSNASHYGVPTATTLTTPASVTFTFWQGSANPYTNYMYFMPAIDLAIVSSPTGCKTHLNVAGDFIMARPSARFFTDKKQGCAPLIVSYTSTSIYSPDFHLTSYTWCNGASPPSFSTGTVPAPPAPGANILPPATFTYATPGTYHPYLIITTSGGCSDTSFVDTITVVSPPSNLSATFPGTVCAGQPVTINMSANGMNVPSSSGIDHWHVTTDEQYFSGCFTTASPTFSFTHLGIHNLTVTASQAGCESTQALLQTIQVNGPLGKFVHETNCDVNRKMIKFHVYLQQAASAILKFGDGNQVSIVGNLTGAVNTVITHTYAFTGNYTPTLTTTHGSNGCAPHVFTKEIKVRDAKARITFNGQPLPVYPAALSCVKSKIRFSSATSSDYSGCMGAFTWFFQSPPSLNPAAPGITMTPLSLSTPSYQTKKDPILLPQPDTIWTYVVPALLDTFRTAGTYTIGLRVKDDNNCVDTETKLFRIGNAEPVFTITPNPACYSNGTVQLTNYTDANQIYGDVITKYKWYFGDGSPFDSTTTGFTSLTHTIYSSQSPTYAVTAMLIAQNQIGCIDTGFVNWQINQPFANLSPNTTTYVCIPKYTSANLGFIANQGYATYSVNFGDPPINPPWYTISNTFTNVTHAYSLPGNYKTTLKVIDAAGCSDTDTLWIQAIGQPTASVFFPNGKDKFCVPGDPQLKSNTATFITPISGYAWTFASLTSTITSPFSSVDSLENIIPAPGIYTVALQVLANNFCPSSANVTVGVYNPTATAVVSPTMFCLGNAINATINIIDGVYKWQWFFGDNVQQPVRILGPFTPTTVSYPYTIYPTTDSTGATVAKLFYESPNAGCSRVLEFPLQVIKLQSDFKHQMEDYDHCLGLSDVFVNTTPNPLNLNLVYTWNFGDQTTGTGASATHVYTSPGTYTVSMLAKDSRYGCESATIKSMTVFPLPSADLRIDKTLSCPDATFQVQGSGIPGVSGFVTATLSPLPAGLGMNLAPSNSFVTSTSASVNTIYTLMVMDENTCTSNPVFDTMFIQEPAPHVAWDTSVIIGQITPLNAFLGNGFTYTWSPLVTALNCDTCVIPNPVSNSMLNITYTVLVEDTLKCSIVKNTYKIKIIPKVSLDVPTAFTPNGDGVNDFIFPDGWGIKKLIYFKVFNRWGQQIFESNDLNVGWDGNFEGVPQNMETYVYQVSVETYLETEPILNKTGTFKLIR